MMHKGSKVLILGCGGMLGDAVYKRFAGNTEVYATDINLTEPWLRYLDVRDSDQVSKALEEIHPDYIIHLAAHTDLEYCELNPEDAYATNHLGVTHFEEYVTKHNTPFVYISTAGIFGGEKDFYTEDDIPNPLSIYGKSKYEGEKVARSFNTGIVVRAGWMMGGGPQKDKKFVNKIMTQINTGAQELFIVDDKLGTPCYTYDLANILYTLLDKEMYGLFHGICDGSASRVDVTKSILQNLHLESIHIHLVHSDYFKETYFAPRPYSEKLLNLRLKEVGLFLTRPWEECLAEYLQMFTWQQ